MAYILSKERDGSVTEMKRSWERYMSYLHNNEQRFPPGAYSLATSDWYFGASDHRAPHDAWLEEVVIAEPSSGERHEVRETSVRFRLLGAYHDKVLEFVYPKVFAYTFTVPTAQYGHYDWRYDEFRLSEAGNLVHEIEWAGPPGYAARWIIEASDVLFTSHDCSAA
jgi:hypothetical protein